MISNRIKSSEDIEGSGDVLEIVNLKQFANSQGISVRTARRWIQQGMPRIKMNRQGKILVDLDKTMAWILIHKQHTTGCLSLSQAAATAKVHRNTIRYWMKSDAAFQEAVVIPDRTKYMISEENLKDWLNNHERGQRVCLIC
ncbi:Helix-turn-helix domain protein [compost metagenome]